MAAPVARQDDFSQVESDDPQVTINQRYEVYFPEKRPFFIENAGFFETPINAAGFFEPAVSLFFTRRIVEPQFGARVTGKVGPWVIGGLASDDRAPSRAVSPSGSSQDGRAGIVVARVKREFAGQSSAGALVTSRDLGPDSNQVVSADTRLRLNPNWILSGQAARSYTKSPEGRLSGPAYYARLDHSGQHLRYYGRYLDFSPDFRAELGFVRRTFA